jgi:hypothetical protein
MHFRKFSVAFVALSMLMALAAGKSSVLPAQAASAQQATAGLRLLVDAGDAQVVAQLQSAGAKLLADYGAFSLWQVTAPSRAPELTNRPSVAALTNLNSIYLRDGNVIDTSSTQANITNERGLQSLLPAPQLQQARSAAPQLWLAQFVGPVKDEWLDNLRDLGLQLVAYMPNNAYVVWGDGAALDKLDSQVAAFRSAANTSNRLPATSVVQWAGAYAPSYRLAPSLQ